MTDVSPIRRKLGAVRNTPAPRAQTPQRIWRRAVEHGWTQALGLEVNVVDVTTQRIAPEDVPELVEEGTLIALIDSDGGYGIAMLSAGLVSALVEIQTLGRVRDTAPRARAPTAIDAALVCDPLDRVLALHEALVVARPLPRPVTGFRFATALDGPREIGPSLADVPYDHWKIDVSLPGAAARAGRLDLILPDRPMEQAEDGPQIDGTWARRINERVMGSEVPLRAELARVTMSVAEMRELAVGAQLTLPRRAVRTVTLRTSMGARVGCGRLGQSEGRKAIRLESAAEDGFIAVGLDVDGQ